MDINQFITEYSIELLEGNGAYFIGAGISKPSNLPDWPSLLQPFASKIGISNLHLKDLPLIAQYVVNEENGNRGPFINSISKQIRKKYSPNEYHEFIVKTNVKTIWTTNYDNLLENAYSNHIVDLKINDDAISRDVPDAQIEIVKMHGCIFNSPRHEIVITEADYEDFFLKRPATAQRLKVDLLQKSFLFIGYGYGDPNIKNIVTEARRLAGNTTRQHYLILKKQNNKEFELWCNNLKKYGIRIILIKQYNELGPILEKLSLKSRGKSVFVSGSHATQNNTDTKFLGEALATKKDVILIDGQSSGTMRYVVSSFMEKVVYEKDDINKRIKFFANPYAANASFSNNISLIPMLKQWRLSLFKSTQIMVAFDGGMGTQAEIEKALELGCIVIPYFQQQKGHLVYFLDDDILVKRLNKYDPDYIIKAKSFKLRIQDVDKLITKIL